MHEYSLVQALVDQVAVTARENGAKSVSRIEVDIGDLAGVEISLLRTAYETFRERTVCAAAQLDVHRVAARWCCPRCDRVLSPGTLLRCPACAAPAELVEGGEIVLRRVHLEVANV
jgi:hydrogenase nickel incorporation protein HypA/HybF